MEIPSTAWKKCGAANEEERAAEGSGPHLAGEHVVRICIQKINVDIKKDFLGKDGRAACDICESRIRASFHSAGELDVYMMHPEENAHIQENT